VISVIPMGKISKYPRDIDILSCAGLCRIAEKSLAVASRSELSDRVASFPGKFRAPIARLAHFPDRRNDIPRALSPCVSRISRRRDPPSALPSPPPRAINSDSLALRGAGILTRATLVIAIFILRRCRIPTDP